MFFGYQWEDKIEMKLPIKILNLNEKPRTWGKAEKILSTADV